MSDSKKGSGRRRAPAFFYIDKDGKPADADLHEAMLDNPEADKFCRAQSKAAARKQFPHLSEQALSEAYGDDV